MTPAARTARALGRCCALVAVAIVWSTSDATAQTVVGNVLSESDDAPIADAVVRLTDDEGASLSLSITDSLGRFRLQLPETSAFRLHAERLGFLSVESPLLEAPSAIGEYEVDLLMRPSPIELPGLEVATERLSDEETDRGLRLILGSSVKALRYEPIRNSEIQDHLARGHNLEDLLRWTDTVGLIVRYTSEGPCYSLRGRGCLDVYLNDLRLNRDFMGDVPLDMIHTIVVVTPTDPVMTGAAVRLYTRSWIRE